MLSELIELSKKENLIQHKVIPLSFTTADAEGKDWLTKYSNKISEIPSITGAYIFSSSDEILYIGASGKIKNKDYSTNWKLPQRLKASRGKNEHGTDVSTALFIQQLLTNGATTVKSYSHINVDIEEFQITVLENYIDVPASYLEAFLLFRYYSSKKNIPKFNLAF